MNVLVTGGAGFIGHHVVRHMVEVGHKVTVLDRLDCSGNMNRLTELGLKLDFFYHDLRAPFNDLLIGQLEKLIGNEAIILHLAAGTHVDRSIEDPMSFVLDNVVSTCNMLDLARKLGCHRFVQFSTDEVFGPAPPGVAYKEWDRYKSGNPYAATKAGAEELAVAYHNTYKVPVIVTHTMNVFGERQHPEKFIPMVIAKLLSGEKISIHANATKTKAGSRFYIHASEVAYMVRKLTQLGTPGEKYNIVGEREVDNLEVVQEIASALDIELQPSMYEMVDFHSFRPGHDLRYALDGTKMRNDFGLVPRLTFTDYLRRTVKWTVDNPQWLALHRRKEAA